MAIQEPKKRMRGSARRARITEAALEVFAARGYHATAMEEIAAAAGVTRSVLYDHFPSKRVLLITVLQEQNARLVEHIGARITGTGSPGRRLRATLDAYFSFSEDWLGCAPPAVRPHRRGRPGDQGRALGHPRGPHPLGRRHARPRPAQPRPRPQHRRGPRRGRAAHLRHRRPRPVVGKKPADAARATRRRRHARAVERSLPHTRAHIRVLTRVIHAFIVSPS
ncbi:TetR/AcrR family transcriptional regulator [Nonomuraea ferruginea]